MTAEIAILNKATIAVAADSAVTRGQNKVHVTANKIFRLSECAPIGMMVYGNADIFGTPWELVAKLFRVFLGSKTFPSVSDYSAEFRKFLTGKNFIDADTPEREMVAIAYDIARRIKKNCSGASTRALSASFQAETSKYRKELADEDDLEGYEAPTKLKFAREYGRLCRGVLTEVFGEGRLAGSVTRLFPELVREVTSKAAFGSYMSGFVIFGFGDAQLFPALEAFLIDGAPYGRARLQPAKSTQISRDAGKGVSIVAFARSDLASLFMEDVSFQTKSFFLKSIRSALDAFGKKIFTEFESAGKITADEKTVYTAMFSKEIKEFAENYDKEAHKFIRKRATNPILSALDGLGIEDMAKLAESLVELASLKLRVSRQVEVVGGPIDVAVLSKVDGFIWIKRKHYFTPEFNPQFFKRYSN